MQLTKNFTLEELTKSQTAIRYGINNNPNPEQIKNLKTLCRRILQPLRDWFNQPIFIASGFRSNVLNAAIGGSAKSQHQEGKAADIDNGESNIKIFNYIRNNLDFDQLIWEFGDMNNPAWVHVSYNNGQNRKQVLKSYKDENGTTKYLELS